MIDLRARALENAAECDAAGNRQHVCSAGVAVRMIGAGPLQQHTFSNGSLHQGGRGESLPLRLEQDQVHLA
jgi:hypothetical protein